MCSGTGGVDYEETLDWVAVKMKPGESLKVEQRKAIFRPSHKPKGISKRGSIRR